MMLRNLNTRILQDDNFGFNGRESTTTTKAVLITKTPVQINAHTHTHMHTINYATVKGILVEVAIGLLAVVCVVVCVVQVTSCGGGCSSRRSSQASKVVERTLAVARTNSLTVAVAPDAGCATTSEI